MNRFEQLQKKPEQSPSAETSEIRLKSISEKERDLSTPVSDSDMIRMKSMENHRGGAVREKQETGEALHERVQAFQGEVHRMSRVMTRLLDSYTPEASAQALSQVLRRSQLREGYAAIGRPLLFLAKAFETTTQLWDEGASKTLSSLEDAVASLDNVSAIDVQPLLAQFEDKAKDLADAMQKQRTRIVQQAQEPLGQFDHGDLANKIQKIEAMEKVEEEIRADLPVISNLREQLVKFVGEAKALRDVLIEEINQRRQREAA